MKRRLRARLLFLLAAVLSLWAVAWIVPEPAELRRPASQVVTDHRGQWLRVFASPDGGMWRVPVKRQEIPQHLVDAVLSFEDARFYWHLGIDPFALARAAWLNITAGRIVSGGSTITMQIARMAARRPRTFSAKLIEMLYALQLELRYSKDELLAIYLNLAPYGGNIEGVGAASYFYFGKEVSQLTIDEAATLAAIPNAPNRLRPDRGRQALRARRNVVLRRLADKTDLGRVEARRLMALDVHAHRRNAPSMAPHLTSRLHRSSPQDPRIGSTIDSDLQRSAEALLSDHIGVLKRRGITNGAVVIIENDTRAVRALVGSADFFDAENSGQVDGSKAPRSPGSTLKPFVYALAFDRGLIGMTTLLEDVPIHFRDWSPKNFDDSWRGVVEAREALIRSLNVPAVRLAQALHPRGLVSLLQQAGFRRFQTDLGRYGLSVVLGGCEVSLLELTNLYATLARGGEHRRFRLRSDSSQGPSTTLFSPGAAYIVSDILTDVRRPELADVWRDAVSIPRLAWKTGTSYGRRDAWSIGYNRRYTVGVWIGNFDGAGVPELVGAHAAAPLLLSIVQVLPGVASEPWIARDPTVRERRVCALSGLPAKDETSCPNTKSELALLDRAPDRPCTLHVTVDVDDQSGARLCSRCRIGRSYHSEHHVVWPSAVATWLERGGLYESSIPEHDSDCQTGLAGSGPVIHVPMDGDEFLIRSHVPPEHQQIALVASVEGTSKQLHWFVDGELFASVRPGAQVMLDPKPGHHRLVAVDGEGRSRAISITVR